MRNETVIQQASATWGADSGGISTDIERIGLITRLQFVAEIVPSATLTGAFQPDGLNRIVQNIQLLGGRQNYFNLPADDGCQGGTLLHQLNVLDGLGYGHTNGAIAAPKRLFTAMSFILHAGARPRGLFGKDNPFDLTGAVPAAGESQLKAVWTTSGNDVLDDTVTVSSAVGRYIINRVVGYPDEIRAEMSAQGVALPAGATLMTPQWVSKVAANSATSASFGAVTDDVITGGWLKRITLLAQDATADRPVRASDEVTSIRIFSPSSGGEVLFESTVEGIQAGLNGEDQSEADQGADDFQTSVPNGVYPIDLRIRPNGGGAQNRDYGWDMRRMKNGDVQLTYIITTQASGDDRLLLFERYQESDRDLAELLNVQR